MAIDNINPSTHQPTDINEETGMTQELERALITWWDQFDSPDRDDFLMVVELAIANRPEEILSLLPANNENEGVVK